MKVDKTVFSMDGEDYVRTVVVEKGVKTLDVTESKEMSEIQCGDGLLAYIEKQNKEARLRPKRTLQQIMSEESKHRQRDPFVFWTGVKGAENLNNALKALTKYENKDYKQAP